MITLLGLLAWYWNSKPTYGVYDVLVVHHIVDHRLLLVDDRVDQKPSAALDTRIQA